MLHQLIEDMIRVFADRDFTEHALKVLGYARTIGGGEGISTNDMTILEAATTLHDIGIPAAIQLHGSAAGPYQEKEGARIAPPMLEKVGLDTDAIQRATFLIAHHHSPEYVAQDKLLQILLEADALVNLSGADQAAIAKARSDLFKTAAGKRILDILYPQDR